MSEVEMEVTEEEVSETTGEETTEEQEVTETVEDAAEPPEPEVDQTVAEMSELRGLLRTMRQENADLANEVTKLKTVPAVQQQEVTKTRTLYDEEGNPVEIPLEQPKSQPEVVTSTNYDNLKAEFQAVTAAKQPVAESLYAMMKLTPEYKDIGTVVTQPAVETFIEGLATQHAKEAGIPFAEADLVMRTAIWKQPNPYEFIYKNLKSSTETGVVDKAPIKTPPVAPTSVATLGSGSPTDVAGWTEAKILAMPVEELHTVPKDVYDKYMRNELK